MLLQNDAMAVFLYIKDTVLHQLVIWSASCLLQNFLLFS